MGNRYLVISSDGHAGPPAHIYREYLEEKWLPAFDEHQAVVAAGRPINQEFVEEWDEETGDHDMKSAYDATTRDSILDSEGVVAEVLLQLVERRHLMAAGRAPCGPQVHQHGLA